MSLSPNRDAAATNTKSKDPGSPIRVGDDSRRKADASCARIVGLRYANPTLPYLTSMWHQNRNDVTGVFSIDAKILIQG